MRGGGGDLLRDELLSDRGAFLRVAAVVTLDDLDGAAEDAPARIDLLGGQLRAVQGLLAVPGVVAGQGSRYADQDRISTEHRVDIGDADQRDEGEQPRDGPESA